MTRASACLEGDQSCEQRLLHHCGTHGGGKKQKVRPGDILGALTGDNGINGNQVGKIQIFDNASYVAVQRKVLRQALTKLTQGKLKGRTFKVRHLR